MTNNAFFILIFATLSVPALAHKYPFDSGESKLRKIYSEQHYQWKVDNQTKLKGSYLTTNNLDHTTSRRSGKQKTRLKSLCKARFILTATEAPDNRLRKLGKHYPVDGHGFLLMDLQDLSCTLQDNNGSAAFSTVKGAPHSAKIETKRNTQDAHNALKNQIDKFTEWWDQSYVISVNSVGNSGVYRYQGNWRDGNLTLDTGLFSGAFINFAKPSLDENGIGSEPLKNLLIPQPMFMEADDVFGPNRIPKPVDSARVTMERLAGGIRAYHGQQKYNWRDPSVGGSGAEVVHARFELVPAHDFGYVHKSQWKADIKYQKKHQNTTKVFRRSMEKEFHLERMSDS